MSTISLFRVRAVAAVVLFSSLCAVGCGKTGARDLSLDPELARQSFTSFLESWKQGQSADALESLSPAIVAGDEDWSAGTKLVSYKIVEREFNDGTNLHLTAELQLAAGKNAKKAGKAAVTYVVGTSPVITIFRK